MENAMTTTYLEWLGTGLQTSGAIWLALNVASSRMAYPLMLLGSIFYVCAAIEMQDAAILTLNAVFASINIIGIWRWWK